MGYIFEAEIESIIHTVRVKTIGEEDGILLRKILSSNIHPAIKAYFKAEVEKILAQERSLEYRSKKFSYSFAAVKSLEEQIDLLLIQHYHFSLQEFESLLDESVHFQFNYLCRPQWTLLNFIVGDQRRVASSSIEKRLRYCVDYSYFPELIKRYMVDHGLAEMTYEEFKLLIEKIDREVVVQHSSLELAHMTRALFDFVESGKMVPQVEFEQQALPINAAIVFFEDKHLHDIRVRLEFERDKNRVVQITIDRLADIIEMVRGGKEEITARTIPAPVIPANEVDQTGEQKGDQEVAVEEADSIQETGTVEQTSETSTPNEKQWESPKGALRAAPLGEEILDLFPNEEQGLLIKKLFANNTPAFYGAITEISSLEGWDEVAQYLDALFLANDVKPFSAEAVVFTDKLFAHFHSSETGNKPEDRESPNGALRAASSGEAPEPQ